MKRTSDWRMIPSQGKSLFLFMSVGDWWNVTKLMQFLFDTILLSCVLSTNSNVKGILEIFWSKWNKWNDIFALMCNQDRLKHDALVKWVFRKVNEMDNWDEFRSKFAEKTLNWAGGVSD